jgi:hypothetical protein
MRTELAEDPVEGVRLSQEQLKRRRGRSLALAWALVALVVLMIALTIVNGPGGIERPI